MPSSSTPTASTSSVRLEDTPALLPASPSPAESSSSSPLADHEQPPRKRKRVPQDRDSLTYALKSGLAGGIAGPSLLFAMMRVDRGRRPIP